ncbi:MAG: hypothetical protein PVG07_12825, partial [Acidobacteriota bacterium]
MDWTIDDLVRTEVVEGLAVSRDGRAAAWIRSTVVTVDGEERRIGNLWLTRFGPDPVAAGGPIESIPLTRTRDRMASPAFSPDGRRVAFLTDRPPPDREEDEADDEDEEDDEDRQVWVIPTDGGEAYPVTRFDRPVRAFDWIDDDTLAVLAPESKSAWELEREKRHDDAEVVDDAEHEPPVRLFRVRIRARGRNPSRDGTRPAEPAGKVTRLTGNDDWIDSLAVSPDGRRA